jgi:hypothetical protein
MRILTAVIQSVLVGAAVLVFIKIVQSELADRQWWKRQVEEMQAKSIYKP